MPTGGSHIAVFNRSCALLDRLGWLARDPEQDTEINLDRYRWTVEQVLGSDLELYRSIAHEDSAITTDAERQHAAERIRTIEGFAESVGLSLDDEHDGHHVKIPDDFTDVLVEALLGDLRTAALEVDDAGMDPDCYPEPLERFDSIRELLDAIDWGARADIDLDLYGYALQAALSSRLDLERHMLAAAVESIREGHKAAETDKQHAYGYQLQIERFMNDAGLTIPQVGEQDA
ncbi:MAG: hypothetical protein ACLP1Q_21285 [Solirubrobacteraceae bacterium]